MNFELSEELKMLQETVRSFAAEKIAPFAEEWDHKSYFPYKESVKPMGELGSTNICKFIMAQDQLGIRKANR